MKLLFNKIAVRLGLVLILVLTLASAVSAMPAPWYWWRSQIDGARVCRQTSPGSGWVRDSAAFEAPKCQGRTRSTHGIN